MRGYNSGTLSEEPKTTSAMFRQGVKNEGDTGSACGSNIGVSTGLNFSKGLSGTMPR